MNDSTVAVEQAYPDLPPFSPNTTPVATLGLETLIVGYGVHLATKLTDKAVDELLSKVYADQASRPLSDSGLGFALTASSPMNRC